jgi:hypothetical protein
MEHDREMELGAFGRRRKHAQLDRWTTYEKEAGLDWTLGRFSR